MKINEFINNDNLKETFDRLKENLLYEVAHLSNPYEKAKSKSSKEILSYGDDILPLLINEIKKGEYPALYTLYILVFNLIEKDSIKITENEAGNVSKIKKHIIDWWDNNKHNYGK